MDIESIEGKNSNPVINKTELIGTLIDRCFRMCVSGVVVNMNIFDICVEILKPPIGQD